MSTRVISKGHYPHLIERGAGHFLVDLLLVVVHPIVGVAAVVGQGAGRLEDEVKSLRRAINRGANGAEAGRGLLGLQLDGAGKGLDGGHRHVVPTGTGRTVVLVGGGGRGGGGRTQGGDGVAEALAGGSEGARSSLADLVPVGGLSMLV